MATEQEHAQLAEDARNAAMKAVVNDSPERATVWALLAVSHELAAVRELAADNMKIGGALDIGRAIDRSTRRT